MTLAETGGAQTYVASLLPAVAHRFEVVVAAYGPGPLRAAAEEAGVRYVPLRQLRRPIRPWRDLAALVELWWLLRRERPEILHASSSKAGILGRAAAALAGVPVRIFTAHGWAFAAQTGAAALLYRWADRAMRPLTAATVCVAEQQRAAGLAARTCDPDRTVVIPNAVDAAGAPRARHDDGGLPLVVAVGRLKAPKDPLTLVRALARLPAGSYEAVLVGEGPDRPRLAAEIDALGLGDRVRLAGDRRDVPELLAGADVFVLSSASEGMPVSVLEAMAAGLPVVASRVGGIPELVVDG
ncbi:MAG TPA: glycosyltransferase, partial [Gaiellaceae bacterium]|nr:glycosyltransferase [Gaiellaceae bacterium]